MILAWKLLTHSSGRLPLGVSCRYSIAGYRIQAACLQVLHPRAQRVTSPGMLYDFQSPSLQFLRNHLSAFGISSRDLLMHIWPWLKTQLDWWPLRLARNPHQTRALIQLFDSSIVFTFAEYCPQSQPSNFCCYFSALAMYLNSWFLFSSIGGNNIIAELCPNCDIFKKSCFSYLLHATI